MQTIELPPALHQLIEARLASGKYDSEEQLLTEAIELLDKRDRLADMVEAGVQQLDRGDIHTYAFHAPNDFLDDIRSASQQLSPSSTE